MRLGTNCVPSQTSWLRYILQQWRPLGRIQALGPTQIWVPCSAPQLASWVTPGRLGNSPLNTMTPWSAGRQQQSFLPGLQQGLHGMPTELTRCWARHHILSEQPLQSSLLLFLLSHLGFQNSLPIFLTCTNVILQVAVLLCTSTVPALFTPHNDPVRRRPVISIAYTNKGTGRLRNCPKSHSWKWESCQFYLQTRISTCVNLTASRQKDPINIKTNDFFKKQTHSISL